MISKIARHEVEKMWKEGLSPSFDDIVVLNSIGCKVEKGKEAPEFSSLPRRCFLGDFIFEEPSLLKRIYIDKVKELLQDDYYTWLFFLIWVLNQDDNDLPKLDNITIITDKIKNFKDKMLGYTERQIQTVIDYCLNGNDPDDNDYNDIDDDAKSEISSVFEIPEEFKSVAHEIYCQMMINNLPHDCVYFTLPTVERMIYNSLMKQGVDVMKNELALNCGKFYQAVGKIRTKLSQEKK